MSLLSRRFKLLILIGLTGAWITVLGIARWGFSHVSETHPTSVSHYPIQGVATVSPHTTANDQASSDESEHDRNIG
jgi:hypothetical protein